MGRRIVIIGPEHRANLQALADCPAGKGLLRSRLPWPRYLRYLLRQGFADSSGDDWCSAVYITEEGRAVLLQSEQQLTQDKTEHD